MKRSSRSDEKIVAPFLSPNRDALRFSLSQKEAAVAAT
jgi:hypothetical protein